MKKIFDGKNFTATKWDTGADKAKFANHFVRFIEGDFKPTMFYDWFYRRLMHTFGHIAHYNREGFYDVQFGSRGARLDFLRQCIQHPHYGDPHYTYSDVEIAIANWVKISGKIEKLREEIITAADAAERELFNRLKAKFEPQQKEAA